jgi:iron complex outermembrane recepter protein
MNSQTHRKLNARTTRPFRKNPLQLAVCLALGTALIGTVQAQESIEEVRVTGSRLSRTTMDTPTPVTTMSASELASMAPGNLIDALIQMPQFYANLTPDGANGGQNAGGSNVNLRGAGTNRTLTLLNGRRVVSSNRFGTVDIGMFPEDLLRSVETVTGGASASYGTDAVAGVVNFILDTDYVGFKAHAQSGRTEYGDGHNWEGGVAFGYEFDNGLHVLGSFSAYDMSPIRSPSSVTDRGYIKNLARITNPDPNGPTEIIRPWVRPTSFSDRGILIDNTRPALNRLEFNPDGSVSPIPFNGVGALTAGCQCYSDPANGLGINWYHDLNSGYERENLFLYADYDFGDRTNVFGQVIAGNNRASDTRESISLLLGWVGRVYPDNAFMRPEVSQLLLNNGITNLDGYTATGAPRGGIGYGFFPENVYDSPLGLSVQDTENRMTSLTFGFTHELGGFLDGWNLEGYYQKGRNSQDFITLNGVRVDRLQMAMEAVTHPDTGQPICRVNLPQYTGPISQGGNGGLFSDCVPINTFGGLQNVSQGAADYVMDRDNKVARQWTYMDFFELVMTGQLHEGFGAGSIDAAFGASYRKEKFAQATLDPSDEFPAQVDGTLLSAQGILPAGVRGVVPDGRTVIPGYNGIPGLRFVPAGYLGDSNSSSVLFSSLRAFGGSYDVKEVFGEVNVPLLSGASFADNIETSLAARWADYEGSGEIWAWKVGLNWTINDELRVRATRSRDIRAATLRERYDQTRGGINVRNPWDNNTQVSAASLSGGNPNVSPEEADTITAGIIYRPSWLSGFSASLDWYEIDINQALAQLTAQNIVDNCRNGDLFLCQYVFTPTGAVTNPTTNDFRAIDRVESLFINLANQRISGVDMELTYSTDVSWLGSGAESLSWRFLASWLDENSVQSPGGFRDDRVGQIGVFGFAENKITTSLTYNFNNYSAFLQARWIDGGVLDRTFLQSNTSVPASARPAGSNLVLCNNGAMVCSLDNNTIPSITYWDARLSGRFGEGERLEVFANINNLLDRKPHFTPGTIGRTGVGLGINQLYDILGRRYTVGFNYEF